MISAIPDLGTVFGLSGYESVPVPHRHIHDAKPTNRPQLSRWGRFFYAEPERHAFVPITHVSSDGSTNAALAKIDLSTADSVQSVFSRLGNRRVLVCWRARVHRKARVRLNRFSVCSLIATH
jgi:hypothetical protein